MKKYVSAMICLLTAFLFTGCAALLPSSKSEIKSPWESYVDAKNTFEKIVPYKTTLDDLKTMGIDPYTTPNIAILNANDIAKLYLFNDSLKKEDLDPGIQECLTHRNNCQGFVIMPEKINDKHIIKSNWEFFLDWLGFKRVYEKTGWRYKNLLITIRGLVIFKECDGGTAMIGERKVDTKPLGPLQDTERIIDTGKQILK